MGAFYKKTKHLLQVFFNGSTLFEFGKLCSPMAWGFDSLLLLY